MLQRIKKHKKIIVIFACIGILFLIGVGIYAKHKSSKTTTEDTSVLGFELQKQDMTSTISTSGTVESATVTDVTTELTSPIKELKVSLGDRVEKGQVLCTFDGEEIQQQISELQKQQAASQQAIDNNRQRANQAVVNAQSLAENKRAALEEAKTTYEKIKQEEKNKNAQALADALAALQNAQNEYDNALASITEAQNTLEDANLSSVESNSELTKLQRQLGDLTVVAAQSGTITQLNVSQGSIPNGSLMKIEDPDALKVKVNIKEKDILKLAQGQGATIVSEAVGTAQKFSGTVDQVINFTTSTNTGEDNASSGSGYSAIISVEPGTPLLLGMSVKVEIVLSKDGEQLAVPYDAIVLDKKNPDKGYIFQGIKQKDGTYKIKKVNVKTGVSNDYYTSISENGLEEGDVIVNDPSTVKEGDSVSMNILSEEDSIEYDSDNGSSSSTTVSEE